MMPRIFKKYVLMEPDGDLVVDMLPAEMVDLIEAHNGAKPPRSIITPKDGPRH